eukprot:14524386-Alexandrium_andersonii.AAC.1
MENLMKVLSKRACVAPAELRRAVVHQTSPLSRCFCLGVCFRGGGAADVAEERGSWLAVARFQTS